MTARDYQLPGRSSVIAANGICATSHPLASKTAVQILESGGNAVDAAIAAAVLLGLCEPQMTGLGGDAFVLLQPGPGKPVLGLNASGRAPAAQTAEGLRARGLTVVPPDSADAITIPGAVDGFCRLSAEWGRLGLDAVLAPAIRYAESGVPVAPRVASDWAEAAGHLQGDARNSYLLNGAAPLAGAVFRAPGQAEVLRRIARAGRDGFYQGEVAEDMVASLNALGGCHSLGDFAACRADWVEPVSGFYRGMELLEMPPNGQGATAILMAKILAGFDLAGLEPWGAARAHLEAEAGKLAYDARNRFIADPDRSALRLDHMLSDATARALADLIDPGQAMQAPAALAEAVHRDTIYLTVVDRDRMVVSLIYSVYHAFGSGLASARFGINFQNRGAGFTLTPGHPNELAGGKRPMHTIIPAMLRQNGEVLMPFGVMGGAYQPTGHVRVLTNMVDFGLHPQAAIDGPRSFCRDGVFELERGYGLKIAVDLTARGHVVATAAEALGGAQAILIDRDRGILIGASDPRKDGCALGY